MRVSLMPGVWGGLRAMSPPSRCGVLCMLAPVRPFLPGLCCATLGLGGCVWGVRGGPAMTVSPQGATSVQGGVTGVVGFGTTKQGTYAWRSEGVIVTGNLAGGVAPRRGGTLEGALGLGYFTIPEHSRWGWTLGAESGLRGRGERLDEGHGLLGLRGGALFRLRARDRTSEPLNTLGIELTMQGALPFDGARHSPEVVFGAALTLGLWHVHPFHL